jgi:RHS repeat-associated protein
VTDGTLPPGLQNHSLPEQTWANGLKKFKVSFEIVRKGASNENSSQSGIKDDIIMYYHNDHLGTPLFLTDETGSIVWRREQTSFGVTSFERGTTTENLRFPGQYWDAEKQSSYNIYRDGYTPSLGRYGQADPIGQSGGINLYPYANGNVLNNIDPSGRIVLVDDAVILAVGATVITAIAIEMVVKNYVDTYGAPWPFSNAKSNEKTNDDSKATPLPLPPKDDCENNCPPCKLINGSIIKTGTISYRWDRLPANKIQHGIAGDHLNLYMCNQNPNNCRCFWQRIGTVPPPPQDGWIPIQPFIN